jgi:hypothetical protein
MLPRAIRRMCQAQAQAAELIRGSRGADGAEYVHALSKSDEANSLAGTLWW